MADHDNTPRVARLCRYPVKGFGPEQLDAVALQSDRGIPGDRAFAITGESGDLGSGAWMPCSNFVTLMATPELARYEARIVDQATVAITGPDAGSITLTSSGPADSRDGECWRSWFASPALPRLAAAAGTGYWDHRDAQVSIINLATLRCLRDAVGEEIDPFRFRANIYIEGLDPWAELEWVGREAALGGAGLLQVLRPIDRCAVTSVNPATGARNINVPYALGRRFGHVFCGVYARVARGGHIERGAPLEIGAPARPPAQASTAPAPIQWPRPFRVAGIESESPGVRSLWLDDPFTDPAVHAGQNLRIHHAGPGHDDWRSYTVSGWSPPRRLRITVKREPGAAGDPPGRVSGWLHDSVKPGDTLMVSGPHGGLPGDAPQAPLVLVSGGIGITPTAAILRERAQRGRAGAVHVLHGARSRRELALWSEVRQAVETLGGSAALFLSREDPRAARDLGAHAGRMPASAYLRHAPEPGALFHVCGPAGMVTEIREQLRGAGVGDERILVELFASPRTTAKPPRAIDQPGPFEVLFQRSGKRVTWRAADGSILELASQAGLDLPAGCHSGGCMTCRQRILSGRTQALVDPPVPLGPGEALLCSSAPGSDVIVDA